MSQFPVSMPGIGPGSLTLTPRMVFVMDTSWQDFLPKGAIIDPFATRDPDNSLSSEIRPGLILGKITNTGTASGGSTAAQVGLYGASVIGTLTAAITNATTVTAITLTAAAATELVRRVGSVGTLVLTGAPTAAGVVASNTVAYSAVNTSTGVVTVTTPATAYVAGSYIGANDGTAVPLTIFANTFPARMTDVNGTTLTGSPDVLIPITNKPYLTANIVNYPPAANTTQITYLKTKLRIPVPAAAFDDDF